MTLPYSTFRPPEAVITTCGQQMAPTPAHARHEFPSETACQTCCSNGTCPDHCDMCPSQPKDSIPTAQGAAAEQAQICGNAANIHRMQAWHHGRWPKLQPMCCAASLHPKNRPNQLPARRFRSSRFTHTLVWVHRARRLPGYHPQSLDPDISSH